MPAVRNDITIEAGATFTQNLQWKNPDGSPINLTGYSARMQVRERAESPSTVFSLTSPSGGITITPLTGTIDVKITDEATAAAITQDFIGVYDLELQSPDGDVWRLVEGRAILKREVTR